MSDEPRAEKSITDELSKLGKQVAEAIRAAWESEDRRKLQAEIAEGLQKFGQQVGEALEKAGESEVARQLRQQAEKVVAEVRETDVAEEIRKGLLAGLEAINKELSKLLERLEAKEAKKPPEAGDKPESSEPGEAT